MSKRGIDAENMDVKGQITRVAPVPVPDVRPEPKPEPKPNVHAHALEGLMALEAACKAAMTTGKGSVWLRIRRKPSGGRLAICGQGSPVGEVIGWDPVEKYAIAEVDAAELLAFVQAQAIAQAVLRDAEVHDGDRI